MMPFLEKYINPFTDFGFKKLFGEEVSKDLLLDFLNELLSEEQGKIVNLTYLNSDKLGTNEDDRRAIFDLYCENEKGDKFIVELLNKNSLKTAPFTTPPSLFARMPKGALSGILNSITSILLPFSTLFSTRISTNPTSIATT